MKWLEINQDVSLRSGAMFLNPSLTVGCPFYPFRLDPCRQCPHWRIAGFIILLVPWHLSTPLQPNPVCWYPVVFKPEITDPVLYHLLIAEYRSTLLTRFYTASVGNNERKSFMQSESQVPVDLLKNGHTSINGQMSIVNLVTDLLNRLGDPKWIRS